MRNLISEEEKNRIKNLYNINESFADMLSDKLKSDFSSALKTQFKSFIDKFGGSNQELEDMFKDVETSSELEDKIKDVSIQPTSSEIVGSKWGSCKSFRNKGGLSKYDDLFDISKSSSNFKISYTGPASGLNIAHKTNGTDTIHQVFNVLICEINPWLYNNKLKPDIKNIRFETGKEGKNSKLTISIPLSKSNRIYQLDRRGGWGHLGGKSNMDQKCSKIDDCIGPITHVVDGPFGNGPFGKITEYFITYPL